MSQGNAIEVLRRMTQTAVGRAMSMQDFNPMSRTYGCCDRAYWQYKTIRGRPAATFQQLCLPFALLYASEHEGNAWARSPEMLQRALSAMRFWCSAQHRGGAVDEWYANEHSYCATAFTSFGVSEALLIVRDELDQADTAFITEHVLRSARWLARRFNADVMNQNLAACAGMWNVHLLTQNAEVKGAFQQKWSQLLEHQDDEGWFREYGGADPGYSTLALDLLAALHKRGASCDIDSTAERLIAHLALLITRRSGLAEGLGSRGTCHAFPFGSMYFASKFEAAASLAAHSLDALANREVLNVESVDDRYLAYFYLPQYVQACTVIECAHGSETARSVGITKHTNSGLIIGRESGVDLAVSLKRNGAFNLYSLQGKYRNLGWWVVTEHGERWSSSAWNEGQVNVDVDERRIVIRGDFAKVKDALPLRKHAVAFAVFSHWILRWPALAERAHAFIKRIAIKQTASVPLHIERALEWDDKEVRVVDTFHVEKGCATIVGLYPVADIDVHSPSARQSPGRPFRRMPAQASQGLNWASQLMAEGAIQLTTTYRLQSCTVDLHAAIP